MLACVCVKCPHTGRVDRKVVLIVLEKLYRVVEQPADFSNFDT